MKKWISALTAAALICACFGSLGIAAEEAPVNLAASAAVTTDIELNTSDDRLSMLKNINDGNKDWYIWATPNNTEYAGKYIQFDLAAEGIVQSVALSVDEGLGLYLGIKNIDVQARTGGEWQTVLSHADLNWTLDGVEKPGTEKKPETLTVPFPEAVTADGIKIVINEIYDAYGIGAYRVSEVEIFGKDAGGQDEPELDPRMKNIASNAEVETDIELDTSDNRFCLPQNINDGNKDWWIWATPNNTPYEGKYIQFTFNKPYLTGAVALSVDEGLGLYLGIKNIDVQARIDGEWQTVVSHANLNWTLDGVDRPGTDKTAETLTVPFPEAVTADGIKIVINEIYDAYAIGAYRVSEVEILGVDETELRPDMKNVASAAAVKTDIVRDTSEERFSSLKNINDGDKDWWIWATPENTPYEGKSIEFTYQKNYLIQAVSISTDEGLGPHQGIKNIDVQARIDNEWKTVVSQASLEWTLDGIQHPETDKQSETLLVCFPEIVTTDRIRVIINDIADAAGTGKYRVSEVEIFGKAADPNIAANGKLSTNIIRDERETRYCLDGNLTDGDKDWTMWLTPLLDDYEGKYIQFDYSQETTVSRFSLSSGKDGLGLIQGVKTFSAYFSETAGGGQVWKPIMENVTLKWPPEGIDTITFLLDHPVPLRSIKFVINDIYKAYENKFRISEIEIFGKSTDYTSQVDALERQSGLTAEQFFEVYEQVQWLIDCDLKQGLMDRLEPLADEMESQIVFSATPDQYLRTITVSGGTVRMAGQKLDISITGPEGFEPRTEQAAAEENGTISYTFRLPDGAPYGEYCFELLGKRVTAVSAVPKNEKNILSFLAEGVKGTISGSGISVTLPYGSDKRHVVASFTLSGGASLYLKDVLQESGVTVNDYTAPLTFTVMAEDHTTKEYTVTVSVEEWKSSGTGGGSGGRGGGNAGFSIENSAPPSPSPSPGTSPAQADYIGHWSEAVFKTLIASGVIAPDENGNVSPDRPVTREEMTKMLVLTLGYGTSDEAVEFSDVEPDGWYLPYLSAAVKNHLIQGLGDGRFGVGQSILRQDAAVLCFRTLTGMGAYETAVYADSSEISGYAKEAVDVLYGLHVMQGDENGRFRPLDSLSRAEAAALLSRLSEVRR